MPKRPTVTQLRLIAKMRNRHVTNIQADDDDGFNDNNDEDDSLVCEDNDDEFNSGDTDAFDDRSNIVHVSVVGDNMEHEEGIPGFDDSKDIPVPDNNDSPVPDNNDDEFKDNNDHFDLNDDEDDSPVKDLSSGKYVYQKEENDDSSDDGQGDNTCDDSMENIEMAIFTDTSSFDVDKALVIRMLAVLIPLKVFLSTRLGGAYSETKQGNCALRLSNLLVWTALNSPEKKVLDETTLLPWMEEILRTEYNAIDAYCQYLEDTKLHAASTIRNYLYDYG